jgi:H+/gluconate symporter-like permease
MGALLLGIVTVLLFAFRPVVTKFAEGTKAAVGGALLASMNTASEYGFGAVIAALPGFLIIRNALMSIPDPLVNEAITVTTLAGVTGSASGGLSIALAAMSEHFLAAAQAANIPPEVLHRVAAMASGGMDTLPHNGAVITLLAVTGLTHRQSYKDIFAITCVKTLAVPGATDWLLDTSGLRAGDTFTITAATARAAEVPEPPSTLLALTALLGMTAAYRRKRQ